MGGQPPRRAGQALTLKEAIAAPEIDLKALAAHLDALSSEERVAQTRTLSGADQARLFDAAQGYLPVTLQSLVPPGTAPLIGVAHEGKNSLWAFRLFAKVFYRPDETAPELAGYNRTSGFVTACVGPGYFVAYPHEKGEVLVDYLRTPTVAPEGWPPILRNEQRLSRWVYNRTQDVLRGVSTQVSIGRAMRDGKTLDNWFVLCRT